MMTVICTIIALALILRNNEATQCGQPQVQGERVIAGKDAVQGSWPWQILVYHRGKPDCGGTLIAPLWVVTAGHCVGRGRDRYPKNFEITVGEHKWGAREGYEVVHKVEKVIKHRHYWNLYKDIALLKLKIPVKMNSHVLTACLPGSPISVGSRCYITGWGKIEHPGDMHHTLQQGVMRVIDSKVCDEKNFRVTQIKIYEDMLCAGSSKSGWLWKKKVSGCHGDSGGPFVCHVNGRWELHGVVSHGSPSCNLKEAYMVFANVFYFKNWILEQMAQN